MALPKLNKNVLFLVGALLLGLFAALLSVSYIQQRVDEATAAARVDVAEAPVVVSKRDLVVGEILSETDLVTREIPVDFIPPDALTKQNYLPYVNRMVRAPIKRGAPISAGSLVALYDEFSSVIVPGKVAYTMSVNENNSISGMVAPGDRVDILLTYDSQAKSGGGEKKKTGGRVAPLLENILVLATGARVADMPTAGQESVAFSSVTLELDPAQAQKLTLGQQTGDIRVLLRNVEDRTPFGLAGMTEQGLRETLGGFGFDGVEYIIGGD